ncbi:hypothetical protein AALA79_18255 [Lachnospiraceae bacterium 64-25]|nr:hypothetical protein [Lachnospiraceae bacterium]
MLGINRYAFWGIVVIAMTLLVIAFLIVFTVRYNIKQKYNSINQYLFKNDSYKENLKQLNSLLEEAGITSKKKRLRLLKIIEALKG